MINLVLIERLRRLLREGFTADPDRQLQPLLQGVTHVASSADYVSARETLKSIIRKTPSKPKILIRLIQVCEQMRDYTSSTGYLRHALRIIKSPELEAKRQWYQDLGLW